MPPPALQYSVEPRRTVKGGSDFPPFPAKVTSLERTLTASAGCAVLPTTNAAAIRRCCHRCESNRHSRSLRPSSAHKIAHGAVLALQGYGKSGVHSPGPRGPRRSHTRSGCRARACQPSTADVVFRIASADHVPAPPSARIGENHAAHRRALPLLWGRLGSDRHRSGAKDIWRSARGRPSLRA